jgi:curved DNA-binding protein CbpA
LGTGKTDRKSFGMETLYDLLGALPNDDADGLRAAFRRAVKRAHPDINPEDPNAALKFRRIVRANEILSDVEQRAAYDHLLELTHLEQEQAAKHAVADKVHKLASGVMALAGVSVVAVAGYAMFVQLSANALTPTTATEQTVRESAAIVAAGPAGEEAASASAVPPETSGPAGVPTAANVSAAESTPSDTAETALGRVGPPLHRTPKHAPKFASGYIDRSIILYRLRKFARVFAEQAKHLQRASRPTASSPPQAANANANGNKKSTEGGVRHGA